MRRARKALDRVEQADAHVGNLERLLSAAHQREEELNLQLLSEQMKTAELSLLPAPPAAPLRRNSQPRTQRRTDVRTRRRNGRTCSKESSSPQPPNATGCVIGLRSSGCT